MPAVNSRQGVRVAIAQFFGGTTYDATARAYRGAGPLAANGLSTVRAYPSKRVNDNDYVLNQAAGRGMGAYMIVYLPKDRETRRAVPAVTGRKRVRYQVALAVFHLAHKAHSEDAAVDADLLVEAIKDLIHQDPSLGTTGSNGAVITLAGETPYGIQTTVNAPYDYSLAGQEVTGTYAQIIFDADTEIIA